MGLVGVTLASFSAFAFGGGRERMSIRISSQSLVACLVVHPSVPWPSDLLLSFSVAVPLLARVQLQQLMQSAHARRMLP